MARLGIAVADAFIGCWDDKYKYDLVRPVTYIKRVIDKTWEPLLITPPFPEYPSGHSTQSGAADVVLTKFFGDNFAFEDRTHVREKFAPRKFASFRAAAEDAGISRLYGGIHFRAAIERGLEQGRCIGAYANGIEDAGYSHEACCFGCLLACCRQRQHLPMMRRHSSVYGGNQSLQACSRSMRVTTHSWWAVAQPHLTATRMASPTCCWRVVRARRRSIATPPSAVVRLRFKKQKSGLEFDKCDRGLSAGCGCGWQC